MSVDTAALTTAIGQRLEGVDSLVRIYNATDAKALYPCATIGEADEYDSSTECLDGSRVWFPVHVWTQESGTRRCQQVGRDVRARLDNHDLSVPGHRVICLFFERARYMRDPDPGLAHGVIEFEIEIEAVG